MPDKTYKYISVCERDKPVQTNNPSTFIMHVASCPVCQEKLPEAVIQELEPRLSQTITERKGPKQLTTEQKPPTREKVKTPQENKKAQFDALVKDSPSFQGMSKSLEGVQADVRQLTGQLNGMNEYISSQFKSLGETLKAGMAGQNRPEGEKEDAGERAPRDTEETSGEVLSEEEERVQEGGGDRGAGAGQRPSPFGSPDEIPAAMKPGYKAGEKQPKERPPSDEEKPPIEEVAPREEPSADRGGGGDLPDLTNPKEVEAVEAWLSQQKRKMGAEAEAKTGEKGKKGGIPYIGEVKDTVKGIREVIDAWKGSGEGATTPAAQATGITDVMDLMTAIQKLNMATLGNFVQMIKSIREGEKTIYSSSGGGGSSPSPPKSPPPKEGPSTEPVG